MINETLLNATQAIAMKSGGMDWITLFGGIIGGLSTILTILIICWIEQDVVIAKLSNAFIVPLNFSRLYKKIKPHGFGLVLISQEITDRVSTKFETILEQATEKGITDILLILNTYGGWEFAMSRICSAIRHYKGRVHCYIPRYAMSAGTMIALSCHTLHIGEKSSLGGVDPQLGILFWVHSSRAWQEIIRKKGVKANDESIAMALYAKQYTKLMRETLDTLPMLHGKNSFKQYITNGDIPHSQQISVDTLKKYGIKTDGIDYPEIYKMVQKNPHCIKAKL
jgi:ClpP class serine protease